MPLATTGPTGGNVNQQEEIPEGRMFLRRLFLGAWVLPPSLVPVALAKPGLALIMANVESGQCLLGDCF